MKNLNLILIIILAFIFVKCTVENNNITVEGCTKPIILQITKIVPDSAYIDDEVSIIGTGFGQNQDISLVYFNGTKATEYTSWNDTLIKVKVPAGATSGMVWIIVNGNKSNEVFFKVLINVDPKTCAIKWMTKNLNVDHYRNGDPIPEVKDATQWANLTTGAWCYYNNDPKNGAIYGKLYNWYAVNDQRGLAPVGYHIPSDAEWTELENCLGGSDVAGGKLKEAGIAHWFSPNEGATNSSGFSGLPGGYRVSNGYGGIRINGTWWSSTEFDTTNSWYSGDMYYGNTGIGRDIGSKVDGFSVRCVKDN
jgi:uncharacterized protein (TIGR02145 family)